MLDAQSFCQAGMLSGLISLFFFSEFLKLGPEYVVLVNCGCSAITFAAMPVFDQSFQPLVVIDLHNHLKIKVSYMYFYKNLLSYQT